MKTFRLFLLCLFLLFTTGLLAQLNYGDVSQISSVNHSYGTGPAGGGVSFCDFNGDGWDDLTLASQAGDSIHFYVNQMGLFQQISTLVQNDTAQSKHILWVDYDNDGDKDLYITNYLSPNRLYENDGSLNLSDVTLSAGLPLDSLPTYGACFGDYDRDGWLDLYTTDRRLDVTEQPFASNHLYRNNGDGTFSETTLTAQVADSSKAPFCGVFFDYNNDSWPDIYISQDKSQVNTLLENQGDGTFTDVSIASGTNMGANEIMNAMCVAVGDFDQNGYLDLYISNTPHGNKLLRNNGDGTFDQVADSVGVGFYNTSWGSNFLDADNDGDLDLYVSGMVPGTSLGLSAALYLNNGDGTFSLPNSGFLADTVSSFSNAIGDFNGDGYPDIMVNNTAPYSSMLWETAPLSNHWVKIELEGTNSNRDGIGSWIEVYAGGKKQVHFTHCGIGFLGQNSGSQNFGLGALTETDSIIVRWPSGHTDHILDQIQHGRAIRIIEDGGWVWLNPPTSLDPEKEMVNFSVFPNPAESHFTIRWSPVLFAEAEFFLTDPLGRIIQNIPAASQEEIAVEVPGNLSPGTYIICLIAGGEVRGYRKILIRH
jgi:hypothetical protein